MTKRLNGGFLFLCYTLIAMETFQYYLDAFRRAFDFRGRTSRKAYWYFVLYHIIITIILSLISHDLANLYGIIVLIPGFAATVRRLHDAGKSGWWVLISLIPVIGTIWLIILLLLPSKQKEIKNLKEKSKENKPAEVIDVEVIERANE